MDTIVRWKLSHNKRYLPWISLRIKRSMGKRDKLHNRVGKYQDVLHWDHFRQYRKKVVKMVQKAHNKYVYHTIGDKHTEQLKSFWSFVTMMQTENICIPSLRTQTRLCTTDTEKIDTLNELFLSVFTHEINMNVHHKG